MSAVLYGVGVLVALFVLYGLLRPSPGCMGHCNGCENSCGSNTEDRHV